MARGLGYSDGGHQTTRTVLAATGRMRQSGSTLVPVGADENVQEGWASTMIRISVMSSMA